MLSTGQSQNIIPDVDGHNFTVSFTTLDSINTTLPAPAAVLLLNQATNAGTDTVRVNLGRNPLSAYVYGYDAVNGVISWAPVPSA